MFLSRTPSEGIQLLIRELQSLEQTLTQEKQVQSVQVQVITVQFGEDTCKIRNSRPDYTFEELCHDAAVYFNQDPADCVLRDESTALWPGKAKVKDELELVEDGRSVILAPKHLRVTKDRYTKQEALNWQEVAAHSKLETRLREMQKFRINKKVKGMVASRLGRRHGILRGLCEFCWYVAFLVQLIYVVVTE